MPFGGGKVRCCAAPPFVEISRRASWTPPDVKTASHAAVPRLAPSTSANATNGAMKFEEASDIIGSTEAALEWVAECGGV